jgi:hypothetical protein
VRRVAAERHPSCPIQAMISHMRTPARMAVVLALGLVPADTMRGQDKDPLPSVHPKEFSFFAGNGFEVKMHADRTEVRVEEPIEVTLRITARGAWTHAPRGKGDKKINPFPADNLGDDFYVELKEEKEEKNAWTFIYRLKPKHRNATMIPGVQLMYYVPGTKQFLGTETPKNIPIKVLSREETPNVAQPLKGRPGLYEIATGTEVLARPEPACWTQPLPLAVLLLVPPLSCLTWYWVWRLRHPDARLAARRRKSEAAQVALASLKNGAMSPVELAAAMSDYLRRRFDLVGAEPTPAEAGQVLFACGVSRKLREQIVTFLQSCDAGRFGAAALADTSALSAEAVVLINALEAEPCAQRAF